MRDRITGREIDDSHWHRRGSRYCHPDEGYEWDTIGRFNLFNQNTLNHKPVEGFSVMDDSGFTEIPTVPGRNEVGATYEMGNSVDDFRLLSFYFFLYKLCTYNPQNIKFSNQILIEHLRN